MSFAGQSSTCRDDSPKGVCEETGSQSLIDGCGFDLHGAQPSAKQPRRQHHLYLVFDDWYRGYSIRKVSLKPPSRDQQQTAVLCQDTLPLPAPLVRMEASRYSPKYFVSAFGHKIMAMHPREPLADTPESYFPMFDAHSLGISFGPLKKHHTNPIYLPVCEKLFTLSKESFELLSLEDYTYPPGSYCSMDLSLNWMWKELSRQPFNVDDVTSYCLHPDQRTFLVSTKMATTAATFAFDTKALSWKKVGDWAFPFAHRAHFDPHLNAFVGLSNEADTLGQLYSCDVPSLETGYQYSICKGCLSKLCRAKLFSKIPNETHVRATLVYMGHKSKFCLVQCVSIKDSSDVRRYLYRVTTFVLKRKVNGDLKIGKGCHVVYYKVPIATSQLFLAEDPLAFWM